VAAESVESSSCAASLATVRRHKSINLHFAAICKFGSATCTCMLQCTVRLTVCKNTVKFVPVDLSKSYVDRSVYEHKYLMSMSYLQSKPYLSN